MSRIRALHAASLALPALARGVVASSEVVPAIAEYEGAHTSGLPVEMVAVAIAFVLGGAWLLFIAGRARG